MFEYRDGVVWDPEKDKPAGSRTKGGYILLYSKDIGGRQLAHRWVWKHFHGEYPQGSLDHINGKRSDNRIENLRLATHKQNMRNARVHRDSKTGYKGVYFHAAKNRFESHICVDGKKVTLGYFKSSNEAATRYNVAARKLFGEFAKLNRITAKLNRVVPEKVRLDRVTCIFKLNAKVYEKLKIKADRLNLHIKDLIAAILVDQVRSTKTTLRKNSNV